MPLNKFFAGQNIKLKGDGVWRTLKDAKGGYSILSRNQARKTINDLKINASGLPKGAELAIRYVIVKVQKGKPTTIHKVFDRVEVVGTSVADGADEPGILGPALALDDGHDAVTLLGQYLPVPDGALSAVLPDGPPLVGVPLGVPDRFGPIICPGRIRSLRGHRDGVHGLAVVVAAMPVEMGGQIDGGPSSGGTRR